MRGEGWSCDECGTRLVLPRGYTSDYWDNKHIYPEGWLMVMGPVGKTMMEAAGEHHFCSWSCVENYAYVQRNWKEANGEQK